MRLLSLTYQLVLVIPLLVPGAAAAAQDKDRAGDQDSMLIAAQKICPVSGQDLHAMGSPMKAKVGEQTVFLCCKGCMGKKIPKEHWARLTANLREAQGHCPVLGSALPRTAKSVVVKGRRLFVCCPPCIEKIQADPEKYLAIVDAWLAEKFGDESSAGGHGDHGGAAHSRLDHAAMSMRPEGMHEHGNMASMEMGCSCSLCTEMMAMGGMHSDGADAAHKVTVGARGMAPRKQTSRRSSQRCGC